MKSMTSQTCSGSSAVLAPWYRFVTPFYKLVCAPSRRAREAIMNSGIQTEALVPTPALEADAAEPIAAAPPQRSLWARFWTWLYKPVAAHEGESESEWSDRQI